MNPLVGAGKAPEEVRRPLSVFKRFYNVLRSVVVTFCTLLVEPVFDLIAYQIPRGAKRLLFGLLMQWLPICGTSGHNGRVKSKNLVTKCLIGKGYSGIFYETSWLGCPQGSPARLARKDFPGVKGEIFEKEAVRLFKLPDRPNLLKTLCWTVDSRSCSLVTEYMRDDLSSVVRRKKEELRKKQQGIMGPAGSAPFELHEALEIAIQIANGIKYLHLKGITHGDLKANNVFIDWKEDKMLVKLADFGLLQTKRRSTMVSVRAFCFQMLEWSAPELFEDYLRSTSEDLNFLWTESPIGLKASTSSVSIIRKQYKVSMMKADSYSFALICAFVLGGQMWNAKLSPSELRRQISNSGLRPTLPSECPKTLKSLISLCWKAEPARRPTFSYILKKLQEEQRNLQEGDGPVAAPSPPPPASIPSPTPVPIRSPAPYISSPSPPQASKPPSLGAPNPSPFNPPCTPAPSSVSSQSLSSEPPTITKEEGKKKEVGIAVGLIVAVLLLSGSLSVILTKILTHPSRSLPPSTPLIAPSQGPSDGPSLIIVLVALGAFFVALSFLIAFCLYRVWRRPFHIFISHAGGPKGERKNFPSWLHEAMSRRRWSNSKFHVKPFFDVENCPVGTSFAERIFAELAKFDIGVVVVTPDFFERRWPMTELIKFVEVQKKDREGRIRVLPLFYELTPHEIRQGLVDRRWEYIWDQFSAGDHPLQLQKCREAVSWLCQLRGISYVYQKRDHDKVYIETIMREVEKILCSERSFAANLRRAIEKL